MVHLIFHPGRIVTSRITNPSIYLQIQQNGDENGALPVRYRATRCGIPEINTVAGSRIQKVSAPPCCTRREAGCRNQ